MTRSFGSFDIQVRDLQWIRDGDRADDLCAHGIVTVRIGDHFIGEPEGESLSVSAAALHLLRTLTRNHTKSDPVAEHLIPCCGHFMIPLGEGHEDDVLIIGCNHGLDWEVMHAGKDVILTAGEISVTMSLTNWADVLCTFSDTVEALYERSAPKRPTIDDAAGYMAFRHEWARRRRAADEIGTR